MARKKLNYTFHNPNTEEATIKYITKILAESLVNKVDNFACNTEELIEPVNRIA